MIKKISKYKKNIFGVIGILLTLIMSVGIKYLMKPKYEPLPEVKLKEIVNKEKAFAIMVQNGDIYEEYTSEDNTWPGADYVFKEAKCTDNNGALVEDAITFADGKATLTTNQTIYCTLYFDEKPDQTKDLRAKDPNGNLSTDLQGGMYRYQGTDDVPNWICFGTNDLSECTDETDSDNNSIPDGIDKYMYRIIGITEEGQMKLVKETTIKEGDNELFSYFSKRPCMYGDGRAGSGMTTWEKSLIFKRINGLSSGEIKGTGNSNDGGNTNLFVNSLQYDYLNSNDNPSNWYSLISEYKWKHGAGMPYEGYIEMTGDFVYDIYLGKKEVKIGNYMSDCYCYYGDGSYWSDSDYSSITAKIGMLYFHDYYYSYYDGIDESSRGNPNNKENVEKSWIHFRKDNLNLSIENEWLLTVYGYPANVSYTGNGEQAYGYVITSDGSYDKLNLTSSTGVRPTFYLEPSAKIKSGEGTKDSPFILEI